MIVKIKVFILLGLLSFYAYCEQLVQVDNLLLDAQQVRREQMPILIVFTEEGCPYCEIAKNQTLIPISNLFHYQQKVIVREVSDSSVFYDFNHNLTTNNVFNDKYSVGIYPTVLIFNADGDIIAPRLAGIVNEEFYWNKVDKIIDIAINNLKNGK